MPPTTINTATIDLVVGKFLNPEEKVVSYYYAPRQMWYAERVDNARITKDADRTQALFAAMEERKTGKRGRPAEPNKAQVKLSLPTHVDGYLKELAAKAGLNKSEYVTLLLLKAFAAAYHQGLKHQPWFEPPKDFEHSDATMLRAEFIKRSGLVPPDEILQWLQEDRENTEALDRGFTA